MFLQRGGRTHEPSFPPRFATASTCVHNPFIGRIWIRAYTERRKPLVSRNQSGRNKLCPRDSQPPPRANLKDYANIHATSGMVRDSNCIAIAASGKEQFTKQQQRENPNAEKHGLSSRQCGKVENVLWAVQGNFTWLGKKCSHWRAKWGAKRVRTDHL